MEERVREKIAEAKSIAISSHVFPDPDAVGSVFSLAIFLEELGKSVVAYLECLPYFCDFLPRPKGFVMGGKFEGSFDLSISLDCENIGRLPNEFVSVFKASPLTISIDHHRSTEDFADINFKDPEAPSTGIMVYRVIKDMGDVSLSVAKNIYATIVGDTGSFRYSNTSTEAFEVASELVSKGVDPWEIAEGLYESHPKERFELLKKFLENAVFASGGKIAFSYLLFEDLEPYGGEAYYLTDGFVNFLRGIRGVDVAVFAKEVSPGRFKISLRGKGGLDVSSLARVFGGGGHRNAAGCIVEVERDKLVEKFLREAERLVG